MDKTEETDPPRTVEAVELSLSILEALADLECARVTELAEHLDRSKSGVYWHLVTLREGGFVAKDGDMYCLGRQFVEYGERTKRSFLGNFSKAKEELNRLAFETGEFTQLLVENEGYGLFVAKSGGEDAIGSDYHVGEHQYLHATAAGKSILAALPDAKRTQIVASKGLPSLTESTITDGAELNQKLDRIRDQGYALSDEEAAVGIRAVGTALRDRDGTVLGAISISGPTSRFQGKYFKEKLPARIMESGNVIEITHNYHT
jgi:DNA-binding IclR family transcriptional regulator